MAEQKKTYPSHSYPMSREQYQRAFENYELEYWSNKLGVTKDRLKQAIEKVGVSVTAVEQYLHSTVFRS